MAFPNNICRAAIYVCRMRVTTLDSDGDPSGFQYVTDQLIRLSFSPQYETGTEINVINGCGDLQFSDKKPDQLKRLSLTMNISTPDEELTAMLTNGTLIISGGNTLGVRMPAVGAVSGNGVSIEAWTKSYVGDSQASTYPWRRWIFPETRWRNGDEELGAKATDNAFSGEGVENDNFLNGPANDLVSGNHAEMASRILDTAIPDATCGRSSFTGS